MAKKDLIDLMSLTKQEINGKITDYQFTITGAYGAGKSTFASALFNRIGNPVTFGFEDRFKGIKDIRVIPINSWDDAVSYKDMLKKGIKNNGGVNPFDFNTLIFDPVGRAAVLCEKYVCENNGWQVISDGAYGAGYNALEKEFSDFISELKGMGFKIVMIAHGRSDTITPPRAVEGYQVFVPDVPKKLKYMTQGEADFVFYLDVVRQVDEKTGINKPIRRLYMQNYADYELKVAIEGLPDYIEYETVEEGVDKFIKAFDNAIAITKSKTTKDSKTKTQPVQQPAEPKTDPMLTDLIAQAINIRDKMLEVSEREQVIAYLTDFLGTANIKKCENVAKLTEFVNQNNKYQ